MKNPKTFDRSTRNTALYILVALIFFFIIQRLGLIFLGFSHIFYPLIDEPASGALARDFLYGGLRVPLFVYQYVVHSGDVLIESLLLIPFFKIFGCSIFSTKIFSLTSAFMCLICWIIFVRRYQGIWAAIIFTAFYAFSPPLFARLNLLGAVSSHHIINPIMALQLLCLFMIAEGDKKTVPARFYFICGFLAGLGTYVFYSYIIFNAFCALFIFVFRAKCFPLRKIFLLISGALIGLTPLLVRATSGQQGSSTAFLKYLFSNLSIVFTNLMNSFFYNVPHSLSYATPSREVGYLGILFSLFIFFSLIVILNDFRSSYVVNRAGSLIKKLILTDNATLQSLFCALFPVFYIVCLSLSPKQINPFEYIPNYGLFPTFYPTDIIRYRWLFVLFPFYFAVCSFGVMTLLGKYGKKRFAAIALIGTVVFFSLCGIVKSLQMYSKNDLEKIFYYKGYSHDLVAANFFLRGSFRDAEELAKNYPEENKPSAFKYLGLRVLLDQVQSPASDVRLTDFIKKVPAPYLTDYIYGIVLIAGSLTEKQFAPYFRFLSERYSTLFYENWGFRHLAYKFYGTLFNSKILLQNIPSTEQWFFKDFFGTFKKEVLASNEKLSKEKLLDAINDLPPEAENYAIRGLGKFIGAEMLFEPLSVIDYPLDSSIGKQFAGPHRISFYEGLGGGFAETLCRYWRTLLPPEDIGPERYSMMLEIEWQRCQRLLNKMPGDLLPTIKKGFISELQQRNLSPFIKKYLAGKIDLKKIDTHSRVLDN